jgi:hypothetical protein
MNPSSLSEHVTDPKCRWRRFRRWFHSARSRRRPLSMPAGPTRACLTKTAVYLAFEVYSAQSQGERLWRSSARILHAASPSWLLQFPMATAVRLPGPLVHKCPKSPSGDPGFVDKDWRRGSILAPSAFQSWRLRSISGRDRPQHVFRNQLLTLSLFIPRAIRSAFDPRVPNVPGR